MAVSTDEKPKEKPANGTANGQSGERPPSYKQADELVLELPKLNLGVPSSIYPITRDQCVAHLKFLAVLADLRDLISNNDGLFGLFDSDADKFPESLNEARARIREKRWAVYTARAVERYTRWWFTCLPMSRPQVTMTDLEQREYESIIDCETQILWSDDNMPPIGKLEKWRSDGCKLINV